MKLFKEMFLANIKELVRDREGLFWLLVFPIIFIFIFGIVFSGSDEMHVDIGIVADSDNYLVNQLVESISAIDAFNVTQGTKEAELAALKKGQRSLVLELPDLNYQEISSGQEYTIPVHYDATKNQTNQVLLPVIDQVFTKIEDLLTGKERIFQIKPQPVQSQELSNFDYILPGILAMSLMQLGLFGSLQFLSLRERKIIRGLGVTPLPKKIIVWSEILVRLLVALVQTSLIILIGQTIFKVTIVGSIWSLAGIVIIGSITFISMGFMLISFSKTVEAGRGIIQVIQFPMMFLSGIFFPIAIMPDYIQPVIKAMPLTYLGDALRQVMLGAGGSYSMITNLGVLTGWLIVTLIVAIKFWKWE